MSRACSLALSMMSTGTHAGVTCRLELDDDLVPFRTVAFTQHETIR